MEIEVGTIANKALKTTWEASGRAVAEFYKFLQFHPIVGGLLVLLVANLIKIATDWR